MRHPSQLDEYANNPDGIERAEIIEIHLEECERCRRRLADISGVNLVRAKRRIRDEIELPVSSVPWFRRLPGPATAAAVFLLVLATGATALLLTARSQQPTLAPADQAPTTVPAAPPIVAFEERESFELVWELDSGDVGHFLWIAPERWVAVRLDIGGDQPEIRYYVGKDVTDRFWSAEDDLLGDGDDLSYATSGESSDLPDFPVITNDPSVPYGLLLDSVALEDWREALGGRWTQVDPALISAIAPTHPEAHIAWALGDLAAEFSADGIPVLISSPTDTYRVVSLDRRKIDRVELQTNIAPTLASWRYTITTPEQRSALADAWVSESEFRSAIDRAALCSDLAQNDLSPTDISETSFGSECWDRLLTDVSLVWRLQQDDVSVDEFARLMYEMEGMDEMVAVMAAEQGPIVELDSPAGTDFSLATRGPGWCFSAWTADSGSEGCIAASEWQVPGVLQFSPGWSSDLWGEALGLTSPEVAAVLLEFADGTTITIDTFGHEADLGAAAYIYKYDASETGLIAKASPIGIDGEVIGTYDFQADHCSRHQSEADSDGLIGDLCSVAQP
ncbi:MAG: hypothetical protein U9N84_15110 [Actinomycetota bacterium]|nr:hypothetical protein [Actinomycetota bacterium]